jgi:methyl-accepting chemotaxis protein
MKLGAKLISGFGLLVALAMVLGGLAVYNMFAVEENAQKLALQYVPEVAVANQVERASLQTMLEIRSYGFTGEDEYLKKGKEYLTEVNKQLKAAAEHATKYASLAKLKENAAKAQEGVKQYEQLVEQTVKLDAVLDKLREDMGKAAEGFMKNCEEYVEEQNRDLKKDLATGADAGTVSGRVEKINLMNGVMDTGSAVRLDNWKAQALRSPKIIQDTMKNFPAMEKKLDELKSKTSQEKNLKEITEARTAAGQYKKAMDDFLANWLALQELGKQRTKVADDVVAVAQATSKMGMEQTAGIANEAVSALSKSSWVMIVGLVVALALGVLMAIFLTRSITKPIHEVITGLSEGAQQVASASGQVATASQQLAEGSAQQAAAVEETSSSMEEMSSMTKQNADNADQANHLAQETSQVVTRANQAMGELTTAMADISKAGEDTGKIIKTIDEIAFQTNLLALNAAVEAARAGEAGAGFAVVAEEVRNLAMRAAEAAKNTASLIEGTIKKTKEGSDLVARTNDAFEEVAGSATKVAELVGEIAAASSEQAQGIDQVNRALGEMDKVTQQNAANAEESAAASEELSAQAETMSGFVGQLINVVGTSKNGDGAGRGARRQTERRRAPKALPSPAAVASRTRSASAAQTRARDVIPMEDDF